MAYDDKLGSALTVHTVPTRLAPSQAWPSARTTITNTGHARQEGVGRRTQGLRGSEPAPLPGGEAVGMSLFGRRWPSGDVRSPLTSTQSPDPPSPTPAPFCKHGPQGSSSSVPLRPAAAAPAELLQGGGSPPDAQGPSWLSAPCTEPSKQSGKKTSRHLIKRLLEDRT